MQGFNECGPAALFNSFALSTNPHLQAALAALPGATLPDKYSHFLRTIALKTSRIKNAPLVDFATAEGPQDVTQCGAAGSGCFSNRYPGNLVCTTVTCSE